VLSSVVVLWGVLRPLPYPLALGFGSLALDRVGTGKKVWRFASLAFRSPIDFDILPSPRLAWLIIGMGGLLFVAAYLVDPALRPNAVRCFAYGYGAGIETDTLLDRSAPITYAASVQGKRFVRYKRTT
jgi:hypothetical protein